MYKVTGVQGETALIQPSMSLLLPVEITNLFTQPFSDICALWLFNPNKA